MSTAWLEHLLSASLANAAVACVLAVVAFAASRALRRPAVAHFLWLLVLLKLVTPPIWRIPSSRLDDLRDLAASLFRREEKAADAGEEWVLVPLEDSTPAEQASPPDAEPPSLILAVVNGAVAGAPPQAGPSAMGFATIAAAWLGTAALILIVAVTRILRFDRLLGKARAASPEIADLCRDVARRFGLGRLPEVVIVEARVPPLVWALRSPPRIVLPSELLADLTRRQVETLIAHEAAHLRRRDHWVRWLELIVVAAFWWHPIAWWARRELRRSEEQCCDAWVQQAFSRDVQDYARALFVTVEFLSAGKVAVPRTASGLGEGKLLRRRFEMILHAPLPCRIPTSLFGLLVIAGAAILPWAPGDAFGQRAETPVPAGGASPADAAPEAPRGAPAPARVAAVPALPGAAVAVAPVAAAAPAPAQGAIALPHDGDVEARLSRLEDQLAALLVEMRNLRAGGPNTVKRAKAATAGNAPTTPSETSSEDGKVRYGLSGDKRTVTATDAETGKALWKTDSGARFKDPEIEADARGVVITDKATGTTMHLDPKSGHAHISGKSGTGLTAGAGAGASSGVVIHTEPPAGDVHVHSQRDRLRAEKAKLRARLKEIEEEEASLEDGPETAPVPSPARK